MTSSRPTASPSKTAWKERARTVRKSLTGLEVPEGGTRCEWELLGSWRARVRVNLRVKVMARMMAKVKIAER